MNQCKAAMNPRHRLRTMAQLTLCNPFSRQRIELEKKVLGDEFVPEAPVAWSYQQQHLPAGRANIPRLSSLANHLIQHYLPQINDQASEDLRQDYVDVGIYLLLYRHLADIRSRDLVDPRTLRQHWQSYEESYHRYFHHPALQQVSLPAPGHLFACLVQIRRAFQNIYVHILGESLPAAELRANVWESIFTNNIRRYYQQLYQRLSRLPTLITGPSGTGKELIARAIALSQYIPFDESRQQFASDNQDCFFPLNLSALSETLIESELFGHRKGAFTGAMADRDGWLQQCRSHGAIFLDEIGELVPALQVKLLRVVQQRTYSRLGESTERTFEGKIIGATNRDMSLQIAKGEFREDLYFRLCADRIHTPSLRQQLDHYPDDLHTLVHALSHRLIGTDCEDFARDAAGWIEANLGADYPWRGNIRELEQCVSGILIRGHYLPSNVSPPETMSSPPPTHNGPQKKDPNDQQWLRQAERGTLTADELLQHYCHWVKQRSGSYEATARRLGLDRRTVKAKIQKRNADP